MATKPGIYQSCNTQPCSQVIGLPYNSGWGGVTSTSFSAPVRPASIRIYGSCDD